MTFEITLKRSLLSPSFIHHNDEKPRSVDKVHILGHGLQNVSKRQDERHDDKSIENSKLKVFLCHSKDDKTKVHDLYYQLIDDGFDAWLDEEKLIPGQEWDFEIRKAVRESDVVIVCLSNSILTKRGYVQKEILFALDIADEQPEGTIFLIPARLEECQTPTRLSKWHWVDLFEINGYEKLKGALNLALRSKNTNAVKSYEERDLRKHLTENNYEKLERIWKFYDRKATTRGKYEAHGYRTLESITPDEVANAFRFYEKQLMPTSYRSFIAANHFYMIELAQREEISASLFGRVNACFPGDGYIHNIREMELSFPQQTHKPDAVILYPQDIHPHGTVQSYCIRVKLLATEEDTVDFVHYENLFLEAGFALEFQRGYIDLLDLKESQKDSMPWFHVIGSRWFASIPDTMQEEIRSRLRKLIEWNSFTLNYHPNHIPPDVKTLNKELGFEYGYTDTVLIEPRSPKQVLQIIKPTFEKIFAQSIK